MADLSFEIEGNGTLCVKVSTLVYHINVTSGESHVCHLSYPKHLPHEPKGESSTIQVGRPNEDRHMQTQRDNAR